MATFKIDCVNPTWHDLFSKTIQHGKSVRVQSSSPLKSAVSVIFLHTKQQILYSLAPVTMLEQFLGAKAPLTLAHVTCHCHMSTQKSFKIDGSC